MPVAVVMSKKFQSIRRILGVFGLTLQFFTFAAGQEMNVTLSIDEKRPTELQVSGYFKNERPANESHVLVFAESVAGVSIASSRISMARAKDANGTSLQLVTVPRCCIALGKIAEFSYTVDLKPKKDLRSDAHVSWLNGRVGVLMLGDLLPQEFKPSGKRRYAKVNLEIPNDWKDYSTAMSGPNGTLVFGDLDNATIFVGRDWKSSQFDIKSGRITVLTAGEFQYPSDEVNRRANSILLGYSQLFGSLSNEDRMIALYGADSTVGNWQADTRGGTVFIVTMGMPFKERAVQQLDEQLRHELFHLWIPNSISLTGKYDWFYEGFALYSSLKVAVDSNTIRFDDMLDTLGRAFAAEGSSGLIQLAKLRYNGSERELYSKGLVFAFLCDLALNIASKGKRNSNTLVRELYQTYRPPTKQADGNEAILKLLNSHAELKPLVDRYVTASQRSDDKELINAVSLLENAGLDLATSNGTQRLTVKPKLNSRQKAILDNLGYNSWRKLLKESK